MTAEFIISRDREWLVIQIRRLRRDGSEKIRHVYLTLDEAAILAGALTRQLPAVVQGRSVDT